MIESGAEFSVVFKPFAVIYNDRSEPRVDSREFLYSLFSLKEQKDVKIKVLLLDRSNSGYRCQYIGCETLTEGQQLLNQENQVYTIVWTRKIRGNKSCVVMGMKKDGESHSLELEMNEMDPVKGSDMELLQSHIDQMNLQLTHPFKIHLTMVEAATQTLKKDIFRGNGNNIVLFTGKMNDLLQKVNDFSSRTGFVKYDDANWLENMKRVVQFFTRQEESDFDHNVPFFDSTLRVNILDEMVKQYQDLNDRQKMRIQLIAEEMLMNAIFDAPVDERGSHLYAAMNRNDKVLLKQDEAAILSYKYREKQFWLNIRDSFGSIMPSVLLKYLKKNSKGDAYHQSAQQQGGAGLGLYMIWKSATTLFLRVKPGQETLFSCSVDSRPKKDKSALQSCLVQCLE